MDLLKFMSSTAISLPHPRDFMQPSLPIPSVVCAPAIFALRSVDEQAKITVTTACTRIT